MFKRWGFRESENGGSGGRKGIFEIIGGRGWEIEAIVGVFHGFRRFLSVRARRREDVNW